MHGLAGLGLLASSILWGTGWRRNPENPLVFTKPMGDGVISIAPYSPRRGTPDYQVMFYGKVWTVEGPRSGINDPALARKWAVDWFRSGMPRGRWMRT